MSREVFNSDLDIAGNHPSIFQFTCDFAILARRNLEKLLTNDGAGSFFTYIHAGYQNGRSLASFGLRIGLRYIIGDDRGSKWELSTVLHAGDLDGPRCTLSISTSPHDTNSFLINAVSK
jgi:hypothetical protein